MTVPSATARESYTATGTTFPYGFKILDEEDIQVIVTDSAGTETELVLGTDYTVDGVGDDEGGNVETVEEWGADYTLVILRNVTPDQQTDYVEHDEFPADSHETALDKLTMIIQQIKEELARCVKVKRTAIPTGSDLELTPVADRAIAWDGDAEALTTVATTTATQTELPTLSGDYDGDLATMVAAIGAGAATVIVDVASSVTADLNIPDNITLIWYQGAIASVAAGKTMTVAATVLAGAYQIVVGPGTTIFLPTSAVTWGQWNWSGYGLRTYINGSSMALLDTNGLTLSTGASVNEFSTDGTFAGNSDKAVPTEKAARTYIDAKLPAGTMAMWPTETAPAGFLACTGATISRTTYAALFAAIGTAFGVGDGSTTFNIPDFRGYFFRGWDNGAGNDPGAATRTDRGDGTVGDHVGTKQTDEFKAHTHTVLRASTGAINLGSEAVYVGETASGSAGGAETRGKNISVMVIIKT